MRDISKLIYTGGYIITTIFGYILSTKGGDIVAGLNSGANLSQECDSRCFNYFAVYRVSFALVVYHSLLSIFLLGCKDTSTKQVLIHTRHWPAKTFLWLLCFFGSFFIPSSFYAPYWIAVIALSSFFICVQSLQLVDFACDIAESWISKYDTSGNTLRFKILLISSSSLCYIFALLLVSILYTYYATCQINQAVISINLIAILGISLLSITPRIQERNPRFGLLQAAFISLYGTCLVSSAIAANDITFCTTFFTSNASDPAYQSSLDIAMKYVGLAFTFLSLGYSAFSTGTTNISGDEEEKVSYSFFHFIFALGSFYMAGLLTQWIEVSYMPNLGYVFTKGATSYWIKIATSGVCYLLYSWVLLAPFIFPNRF